MPTRWAFISAAVLALSGLVRADSITVQGFPPLKVTLTGFADGQLQYQTSQGSAGQRPYDKVQQVQVDNEPALTAAEASLAAGKPEASLDDYAKAVHDSATPWVRLFAARRLIDAAGPNGRFEPRLAAYLALLQLAPADAAKAKPALPEAGSRLLDVAVIQVEDALKTPGLADPGKVALLSYLTDIHRRRGDEAAVVATVERMTKVSPGAASDPAVRQQLVGLKIAQAKAALEKKDYAGAARLINDTRATIIDPNQQADALFVLAQTKLATADATDKAARQDAALAFMRVVALATPLPGRPNVLASLRATAGILENTGNPADAAKIYGQISREFTDDPAAAVAAKADLDRLKMTR